MTFNTLSSVANCTTIILLFILFTSIVLRCHSLYRITQTQFFHHPPIYILLLSAHIYFTTIHPYIFYYHLPIHILLPSTHTYFTTIHSYIFYNYPLIHILLLSTKTYFLLLSTHTYFSTIHPYIFFQHPLIYILLLFTHLFFLLSICKHMHINTFTNLQFSSLAYYFHIFIVSC